MRVLSLVISMALASSPLLATATEAGAGHPHHRKHAHHAAAAKVHAQSTHTADKSAATPAKRSHKQARAAARGTHHGKTAAVAGSAQRNAQAEPRHHHRHVARVAPTEHFMATAQGAPASAAALGLQSSSVLVLDRARDSVLLARNPNETTAIASITKLMTAMVTLDAKMPLDAAITIDNEDVDRYKGTHSRLAVGTRLARRDILRLALMSSENRAAASLARTYPGGKAAFITAMNAKARALGMQNSHFADPAGLNPANTSTARDLARMVQAAGQYELIREFTTTAGRTVPVRGRREEIFKNTNRLVQYKDPDWHIELSKTGYTAEAGRCLVMQARVANRPLIFVLLDAPGKLSPIGDANRVRRWLETHRDAGGLAAN